MIVLLQVRILVILANVSCGFRRRRVADFCVACEAMMTHREHDSIVVDVTGVTLLDSDR